MNSALILVDGSSYFFRAFHAMPPLTNSKGQPTGAVYGVINMMKRLMKDYSDAQIVVVFDAKGKTFRHDISSDYKSHRPPMPDDLQSQFQPMVEYLKAMGFPVLIEEGVEADDVIGTLSHQATSNGREVIISTSDKDMVQLINQHVTLINTMSNQVLKKDNVKAKYGIECHQFIDYLTLIGDTSDNIPGVHKCGPKTAVKWLEQYKTLDKLMASAHEITGKIGEHLRASLAHLPVSRDLVTIRLNLTLPVTPDDLVMQPPAQEKLIQLAEELEFKNWLKELSANKEPVVDIEQKKKFRLITTIDELQELAAQLTTCATFCLQAEPTHTDPMLAELAGIAFACAEGQPAYLPLRHSDTPVEITFEKVSQILQPLLENPRISKIGYNLKAQLNLFKNYGITLQGLNDDIMLESYVLNSTDKHDVESLALKYFGFKPTRYEDIAGKGAKQLSMDKISAVKACSYSAERAELILKLHQHLYPTLDPMLRALFDDMEMPLLKVLSDMEYRGVMIDNEVLASHAQRLRKKLSELEEEALKLAGKPFNLNSPRQLQDILFDTLGLPVLSKTPTGQPSTSEPVLQELALTYPLPAIVLEYRSLAKLLSTYIEALPLRVHPKTHRIHTCYNQAVTATGRLSSSEPNLQNIPIRTEEGRLIRKAFVAPPEHVLLAADYSQIELRIMAHLSEDENLLKAFHNGWDIHAATASEIFQVSLEEVTYEQRRRSKAVNFGLIYGMSAFGLAKQLNISRQDAQLYMDIYFKRYPGVLSYMERTREMAHRTGMVETIFGRRLYLPDIHSKNFMSQKAAERMAINAPMQGSAADIIKRAMLELSKWQQTAQGVHMIMQVHDELLFEIHENTLSTAEPIIRRLMENTTLLQVPLKVSIGSGKNWDEAH